MLLQLFVVLLASSLVKSSAINMNIFTDEKTKDVSLTTCDDNACEAICKIFGYKDGLCSADQCMCLNYERANEKNQGVSLSTCDDNSCETICKRFGYKDGLCSDGQCMCLYYARAKHHTQEARSENDCDDLACYLTCIASGSIGGTCAGDSCYCYTFKPLKELKPKAAYSLADSCNFQACDQLCRNLGFKGGACVGDRCDCDNFKPLQEFLSLITPMKSIEHENSGKHHKITKDNDEPKKPVPCDFVACNDFCQRSNHIGGVCIGDSCSCY